MALEEVRRGSVGNIGVKMAALWVLYFLHLPALVFADVNTRSFEQVDTTYTSSMLPCMLVSIELPEESVARCSSICNSNPYCTVFCVKDKSCTTFNAKVTKDYIGPGNGADLHYDRCWSSHPMANDIAYGLTTAASSFFLTRTPDKPVSITFFCNGNSLEDLSGCFESDYDDPPWWRVDLGQSMAIIEVRIGSYGFFDSTNVEFRLGNDTDLANNPLYVTDPVFTAYGSIYMSPPEPRYGRYFFVTRIVTVEADIRVCDIWIRSA